VRVVAQMLDGQLTDAAQCRLSRDQCNKMVDEQVLYFQIGGEGIGHSDIEIDRTVAQFLRVLRALRDEPQRDAGCLECCAIDQKRCHDRAQAVVERRRDEASTGAHHDRVVHRPPQPPECTARGRHGEVKPFGGGGHAPGLHQSVEHAQEVQIDLAHGGHHSSSRLLCTQHRLTNYAVDVTSDRGFAGAMTTTGHAPTRSSVTHTAMVLACVSACTVLVVGFVASINLAVPLLAASGLHPSSAELLWIVDAYVVMFACLVIPAGAAGDRFGRKGLLLAGLAVFALGAALSAVSPDVAALLLGRVVTGVGAACVLPNSLALLIHATPPAKRAGSIAVWAACRGSVAWSAMWAEVHC
jgi:hypothetical protein